MIISIGIDIIEVEDMRFTIETSNYYLKRIFTPQEILYCESKFNKVESYAARYAAKEAVMKAFGTGWDKGVQWRQIEVVQSEQHIHNRDETDVSTNDYPHIEICVQKKLQKNTQQLRSKLRTGKPEIKLTGKALILAKDMGVKNIFLSLSHSKKYAVANVIFEGK